LYRDTWVTLGNPWPTAITLGLQVWWSNGAYTEDVFVVPPVGKGSIGRLEKNLADYQELAGTNLNAHIRITCDLYCPVFIMLWNQRDYAKASPFGYYAQAQPCAPTP
jgi:hypothetical protein